MALIPRVLLVASLVARFVGATPLRAASLNTRDDGLDDLKDAQDKYRGIYWDDAWNECSTLEFNILKEATRKASLEVVASLDDDFENSSAFNRFFVGPNNAVISWQSNDKNKKAFKSLKSNIKQLRTFPVEGRRDRNGNYTQSKQITYRCRDLDVLKDKCQNTANLGAYTAEPALTGNGWNIVFCPYFFRKFKYINEITNNHQPRTLAELPFLVSYEHIMLHEWLHAKIIGIKDSVDDIRSHAKGPTFMKKVYGVHLCFDYAWAFMRSNWPRHGDPPPKVNPDTTRNADNYAWFLTNYWFAKNWGWNDDGNTLTKRGLESRQTAKHPADSLVPPPSDTGDDSKYQDPDAGMPSIPDSDIAADPDRQVDDTSLTSDGDQVNCQGDGANVICDYVGEEWSDYLKDRTQDFQSDGGCTLSHFCWDSFTGGGIDPQCTCTCDGKLAAMSDPRCNGYAGSLPDPPKEGQ